MSGIASSRIRGFLNGLFDDLKHFGWYSGHGDAVRAVDEVLEFFEASDCVKAVKIDINRDSEYDDQGGYYTTYVVGGELRLEHAGEEHEIPIGDEMHSDFEGVIEGIKEAGDVDEDSPIFDEKLDRCISDFASRIEYSESNLADQDFNDDVLRQDHFTITKEQVESCRVNGRLDVELLVERLRASGAFYLPDGMSEAMLASGDLDYSEARVNWSGSSLLNIDAHLKAGMPVDAADSAGFTPIVASVRARDMKVFDSLLEAGADEAQTTPSGVNLVGVAIMTRDPAVFAHVADRVGGLDGTPRVPNLLLAMARGMTEEFLRKGASFDVKMPDGRIFSECPQRYEVNEDALRLVISQMAKRDLDGIIGCVTPSKSNRSPSMGF